MCASVHLKYDIIQVACNVHTNPKSFTYTLSVHCYVFVQIFIAEHRFPKNSAQKAKQFQ